jgi:hypothetical protein
MQNAIEYMKRSFTVRLPNYTNICPNNRHTSHFQNDVKHFLTCLHHITNCNNLNPSDKNVTPYTSFKSDYQFESKEIEHILHHLYNDTKENEHVHILAHAYILLTRIVSVTRAKIRPCELSLLVHVSLCITSKLLIDEPWDNRYWADMVHLTLYKFNTLEIEFLELGRHRLFVSTEQLERTEEFLRSDVFIIQLD